MITKDLLGSEARKIYNLVRRKMKALNLHDSIDDGLIATYAHSLYCYYEVSEAIKHDGYVVTNEKGAFVKNPLLSTQKAYLEQITKIAQQLKITPLERAKGNKINHAKRVQLDPLSQLRKVK